jgi:hypothetical protein
MLNHNGRYAQVGCKFLYAHCVKIEVPLVPGCTPTAPGAFFMAVRAALGLPIDKKVGNGGIGAIRRQVAAPRVRGATPPPMRETLCGARDGRFLALEPLTRLVSQT